jgi:hypothetical protein
MVSASAVKPDGTHEGNQRSLCISRIAVALYAVAMLSAIIRHQPREMFIAVLSAMVLILYGPRLYRFVGALAAAATFLITAIIQMS